MITLFNLDLIHAAGDGRSVNKLVGDFMKAVEGKTSMDATPPNMSRSGFTALRDLEKRFTTSLEL